MGEFRSIFDGLFPDGMDVATITPQGRAEVRKALDALLTMWKERARLAAALGQLAGAADEIERYRKALEESVKLQSHYATILNDYDGGHRLTFADEKAWLERLAQLSP